MDIFRKTPMVSEIDRPTFRKVDTTSNLEARVDVLEADMAERPLPEYTELIFTWWQSGTSAPVILQTIGNTTGLTLGIAQRQFAGQHRIALSEIPSSVAGEVTIETTGINEDGTAPRIFGAAHAAGTTTITFYVFDVAGTKVDNVGNGTNFYATTVIRIKQ